MRVAAVAYASLLAACLAPPRDVPEDALEATDAADAAAATDAWSEPGDAAPEPVVCVDRTRRCDDDVVTECRDATWVPVQSCPSFCTRGGCATPASCGGGGALCGAAGSENCCRSLRVPGGQFSRSYDGVTSDHADARYRATISGFHLDKYEVTAARFMAFVTAYPGSRPAEASGRNPHDPDDPGWLAAWTPLLPATAAALSASLRCDGLTAQAPVLPIRCVTWYLAQAFCIWDGGRLPTEAEWNYAAAGGDEQRVYPWSSPPADTAISSADAVFEAMSPLVPGSCPAGDGRWHHADLAGDVSEWVFDNYAVPYLTDSCVDCANHTAASFRGVRGGSFASTASLVLAAYRSALDPAAARMSLGFRCARDLSP